MVKRIVLPLRERLVNSLQEMNNQKVSVGYFADQGIHEDSKMTYPELMFLQEVKGVRNSSGIIHRRLFENTIMRHRRDIETNIKRSLRRNLLHNPKAVFNDFGEEVEKLLKQGFGDTSLIPANLPSTVALKGKNTPLVDTGDLRDKLTHRIEPKRK